MSLAVRRAFTESAIPAIPACQVEMLVNDRESLLFWVRTGRAQVEVASTARTLTAGQAIWVPAGMPHQIMVDEGSVTFPILLPAINLPSSLMLVSVFSVPRGWEDWMVLRFAHGLGYLRGFVPTATGLLELVAGSRADPAMQAEPSPAGMMPPPLPRSSAAVEVARTLLRSPADPTNLAGFAARYRVGVRTLQRQFAEETGMPFVRWRAVARVAAAATYLDAGRRVGWAGRRVGFATPAGFTRAFREHAGRTPLEYSRSRRRARPGTTRDTLTGELAAFAEHTGDGASAPEMPSAPPIPSAGTWGRINDFHIIVWVYRGTANVTIGDRTWRLRRGDTVLLPAGVRNSIEIDAGSLVLPLGASSTAASPPRIVHFPLAAEDWLLHTVVASYTLIRPPGFDGQEIVRHVRDAIRTDTGLGTAIARIADADPVQRILVTVRDDPSDMRSLAEWAKALGTDITTLRERFTQLTGQSFRAWRFGVRMTAARELLDSGARPGEVGRMLGYAYPSGFTQVFTRAHGITPSTYQSQYAHASKAKP